MKTVFSTQFKEGHKNASLRMNDLMFGINPYDMDTNFYKEWELGFIWAFEKGELI